MKSFKKKMTTPILSLALSLSLTTSVAMALEHRELMWGIKNSGTPVAVDIDPLQSYRLQGIVGEDLNLLPPLKGRKVKVAVLDTGVDVTHPGLKGHIFLNESKKQAYANYLTCLDAEPKKEEKKAKDKKTDAENSDAPKSHAEECREKHLASADDVYPADYVGWSVSNAGYNEADLGVTTPNNIIGRPDFEDEAGHGTHVAGIIASVTDNAEIIPVQITGVAPSQPIKPYTVDLSISETVRGGYEFEKNLSERVARGIIYAMNTGAEVINMSLGWPGDPLQNSEIIRDAILEAQRRNIIIVAAAGNDSTDAILRPCQYRNVICVAASRPDGALASFSNFGMGVDVAAPGVEILSTIPHKNSSVRLPGFTGYDFLSGTSQATPYVSGVIADMLSRGVSVKEIFPRLILGARPLKEELPAIKGPVNSKGTLIETKTSYKKTLLSGLVDMQRSMQVQPQALILPSDKEIQIIEWDRKSANLSFQFNLKNYWKNLEGKKVTIQLRSSLVSEIEPAIIGANFVGASKSTWATNEERTVKVNLQIRDNADPSLSRIQRDLSYQVYVLIDGKTHRQFEVKAEVTAAISKDFSDSDVKTIPFPGGIPQGMSLTPVEENYDSDQLTRDYFILSKDQGNSFSIGLVKLKNGVYEAQPTQVVPFDGDISQWRPRYKMRLDIDGDGVSEYVLGIIEYLDKEAGLYGPYRNHFYVFDQDMRLKKTYLFDDKRLSLPIQFYWMKVGNSLRPAFIARGPEIKKRWDVTDLWSATSYENVPTEKDFRLYYLDEDFKLAHTDTLVNQRVVEVIQPTLAQVKAGILPVLLAKNMGTEAKPSYMNSFSLGEMQNGQLIRQKEIASMNTEMTYRNLIDTFNEKTFSLSNGASEFKGSMWYGLDAHKRQRVTLLDLEQSKIFDKIIGSQREVFDAALQIRAGYLSVERSGVFLLTNSEIEYHDLLSSQVATRSLNRFTFYRDDIFVENQQAITIVDRTSKTNKLPALYTTEGSGLSFGIKIMVPVYTSKGILPKIVAPARLSFKAATGCRALPTPLFLGENSGYALDYYCGDRIKRILLKY